MPLILGPPTLPVWWGLDLAPPLCQIPTCADDKADLSHPTISKVLSPRPCYGSRGLPHLLRRLSTFLLGPVPGAQCLFSEQILELCLCAWR